MTLRIDMHTGAAVSSAGVIMTSAGNPWLVDDALAQDLVNRGVANASAPVATRQAAAAALAGFVPGVRTVLFGDSEVNIWEICPGPTVIAYNSSTGILTFTSVAHGLWTGFLMRFWNLNYASTTAQVMLPITVVDVNTYTMNIGAAGHPDLPNGNLTATLFCSGFYGESYTHWLGQYMQRNGHPLDIVRNAAQSGDTSTGCVNRFATDVAAWSPQLVIMQLLGLNDVSNTATPVTTTIANNRSIIDAIQAIGANLLLLTTNPVASGEARGNVQTMERIKQINRDGANYVRGKRFCRLVDAYRMIVDPTDTTGYAVASYLKSADKIHYNYKGSFRILPQLETSLNNWFPNNAKASTLVQSVADCHANTQLSLTSITRAVINTTTVNVNATGHKFIVGEPFRVTGSATAAENGVFTVTGVADANNFNYENLGGGATNVSTTNVTVTRNNQAFNNPLLLTVSGGILTGTNLSGTVAGRLKVAASSTSTGVASVAAASAAGNLDGAANEQLLAVSTGVAGDQLKFGTAGTTSMLVPSQIVLNRLYQLEFRLRLASTAWGATPISQLCGVFYLTWSTGETFQLYLGCGWDASEDPTFSADQCLHIKSFPISTTPPQAGSTLTDFQFYIFAQVGAGGWTGQTVTIGMSQISCRDVT